MERDYAEDIHFVVSDAYSSQDWIKLKLGARDSV